MKPTPAPPTLSCDARKAQALAGRMYETSLDDELRRLTGADRVRVVRPGQMITMEFDARRLTVELDGQGRIATLRCA